MSRLLHGDEAVAYRAVIVRAHSEYIGRDGLRRDYEEYVTYAGPFGTVGAAKAAITKARRDAARWPREWTTTVTGKVQCTPLGWEDVA